MLFALNLFVEAFVDTQRNVLPRCMMLVAPTVTLHRCAK